jgi:enoyl-[acyl-carrier protein] reductase II
MDEELLRTHIIKARANTDKPFGVNVPLLYSKTESIFKVIIEEQVPVVITSAGNPSLWTKKLKENNIKVGHVVSNVKFAIKSEEAGVDLIIAEGVEAGGHNGCEETTTFVLIPLIKKNTGLPVVAAGGIATGRGMLAAMVLGAEGVQIGSRFAASSESSAHDNFKNKIINIGDGDTRLALKQIGAVRLIRNEFSNRIEEAELRGADKKELLDLLGKGRSKTGMFEGNIIDGELEIGQVAALINEIKPASEIINEILDEYNKALKELITSQ